jgi:hypothetical protein
MSNETETNVQEQTTEQEQVDATQGESVEPVADQVEPPTATAQDTQSDSDPATSAEGQDDGDTVGELATGVTEQVESQQTTEDTDSEQNAQAAEEPASEASEGIPVI